MQQEQENIRAMREMKLSARAAFRSTRTALPSQERLGFTLVELLVVIAITSVLLVIIAKPLIDGFNITNRASTEVESQTAARTTLREVSASLSNAVFIYDNDRPQSLLNIWLYDQNNNPILEQLPYGMVEFAEPAYPGDEGNKPNAPTDPTTGLPINTSGQQASLPLSAGRLIDRYFIGLDDNQSGKDTHNTKLPGEPAPNPQLGMPVNSAGVFHGYVNRWTDPQAGALDNRYTLYHAEFPTSINDPDNSNQFIPNLSLFHTGTGVGTSKQQITNKKTDQLILDQPDFFYDSSPAGDNTSAGNPKWGLPGWQEIAEKYGMPKTVVYRWENWAAISTSLIQTNKGDAISLNRDVNNNIIYDVNARPIVNLLVQFQPGTIANDPGLPEGLSNTGSSNSGMPSPLFMGQQGGWTNRYDVKLYRASAVGNDPMTQNPLTYYELYAGQQYQLEHISFLSVNQGAIPPLATSLPDVGPDPVNGFWTNPKVQIAYQVNPLSGLVNFAFPQWVLNGSNGYSGPQVYLPSSINSLYASSGINRRFLVLDDRTAYSTGNALDQASTISPLGNFYSNPVSPFYQQTVQVVPGSEVVFGPDQNPGFHYGYLTQYHRVTNSVDQVGPNQYKINYAAPPNAMNATNPADPRLQVGYLEFDSQPEATGLPADDPLNHLYFQNSLPQNKLQSGSDVLSDPVEVSYSFQMNRSTDVVRMSYSTRSLITVSMNSRLFDPSSAAPLDTNVTENVRVRNLQR